MSINKIECFKMLEALQEDEHDAAELKGIITEMQSEEYADSGVVEFGLANEDSQEDVKTGENWYLQHVLVRKDVLPSEIQNELIDVYQKSSSPKEREKALEALIESNQKLVFSIAKSYNGQGLDLDDLIQEGNIGLYRAIQKFDTSKNSVLSTYATWWIRQAIAKAVRDTRTTIRFPVHIHEKVYKYRHILIDCERNGMQIPSDEDLAELLGCSVDKLKEIIHCSNLMETVSLSQPINNDMNPDAEILAIKDLIPNADVQEFENGETDIVESVHNEMKQILSPKAYDIMCRRYGIGDYLEKETLEKIGKAYGMSKEGVRQIQMRAERKLRKSKKFKSLMN